MFNKLFSSPTIQGMERALDGSALRQKLIANNIANVDTPGYKSASISFEDQLKTALKTSTPGTSVKLKTSSPRHIQIGGSGYDLNNQVSALENYNIRYDKNNVDIDTEMAAQAKNEIYYSAVSRSISDEFKLLRTVITEGRG